MQLFQYATFSGTIYLFSLAGWKAFNGKPSDKMSMHNHCIFSNHFYGLLVIVIHRHVNLRVCLALSQPIGIPSQCLCVCVCVCIVLFRRSTQQKMPSIFKLHRSFTFYYKWLIHFGTDSTGKKFMNKSYSVHTHSGTGCRFQRIVFMFDIIKFAAKIVCEMFDSWANQR